jgi:hypothetical protein
MIQFEQQPVAPVVAVEAGGCFRDDALPAGHV